MPYACAEIGALMVLAVAWLSGFVQRQPGSSRAEGAHAG